MTGSTTDVVLGQQLENLALATKQYILSELLALSDAISKELLVIQGGGSCNTISLTDEDWDYIFAPSLSNTDIAYVFSQSGTTPNILSTNDINFVFSNQGEIPNVFHASEINHIFS